MTALSTLPPSLVSASSLSLRRTIAEISGGDCGLSLNTTATSPDGAAVSLNEIRSTSSFTDGSSNRRPMNRFTEYTVFSGFVIAWRRASSPTNRSPVFGFTATTDGVVRRPSLFSMISGSPACITAIAELVVPRSIPIALAIFQLIPRQISVSRVVVVGPVSGPGLVGAAHPGSSNTHLSSASVSGGSGDWAGAIDICTCAALITSSPIL